MLVMLLTCLKVNHYKVVIDTQELVCFALMLIYFHISRGLVGKNISTEDFLMEETKGTSEGHEDRLLCLACLLLPPNHSEARRALGRVSL